MIEEKRMVMVGSTGRNSGKTILSTELIKKYKEDYRIVALKVTTIEARDMKCPRGGEGCGVCTSLRGDYDIRIEEESGDIKDTQRLKKAGADRVYWIRAYPEFLSRAFEEFLGLVEDADLIICESNSLRNFVKPGIFIMIDNTDNKKQTAQAVYDYADFTYSQLDHEGAREILKSFEIGV